jgi:hypothetical protein
VQHEDLLLCLHSSPDPHHEQQVVGNLAGGTGHRHLDGLLPGLCEGRVLLQTPMRACKCKRTEKVPCPRPRLPQLTLPTSYARRNTPYFSGSAVVLDGTVAVAASARTRTTRAGLATLLATTR